MEKEIEVNIYKRFPSLGNSPDRLGLGTISTLNRRSNSRANESYYRGGSPNIKLKSTNNSSLLKEDVTHMKRGWGVKNSI